MENKNKFTSGPWAVDSAHDQVVVANSFGNVAIAETYGEDWEANARLIAAAPDGVRFAEMVLNNLDYAPSLADINEIRRHAESFLKKALGE